MQSAVKIFLREKTLFKLHEFVLNLRSYLGIRDFRFKMMDRLNRPFGFLQQFPILLLIAYFKMTYR